ncbi:MAG: hypothetical protein ABIH26_07735 [Candidatus Eisenbacteria bacterium]
MNRRLLLTLFLCLLLSSCRSGAPDKEPGAAGPNGPDAGTAPLAPVLFRPEVPGPPGRSVRDPAPVPRDTSPPRGTQPTDPPRVEGADPPPQPPSPTLRAMIDELVQRLVDRPDDPELHRQLAVLQILAGDFEKADQHMSRLNLEEDDFLRLLAAGLSNHLGETEKGVKLLEDVRRKWRTANRLLLKNLSFCSIIFAYGNYRPIAEPAYSPGQSAVLYGEVENYTCIPDKEGTYRVHLTVDFEIRDAEGRSMQWIERSRHVRDLFRQGKAYVNDVFLPISLELPANIPRGDYTLLITVHDELGKKTVEGSIGFKIR